MRMDIGFLNSGGGGGGGIAGEGSCDGIMPGNKVQVCVVYASILADILITAFTDTLPTTEVLTIILLLSLQTFLLLAIVLAFFLLTTSVSPHVKLGLYNKYLRQHRAVFALCLLALLLLGSVGAYRLVLVYRGLAHNELWGQPGYLALWVMQRISLLLLQCTAAHAAAMSFKDAGSQGQLLAATVRLMATMRRP